MDALFNLHIQETYSPCKIMIVNVLYLDMHILDVFLKRKTKQKFYFSN